MKATRTILGRPINDGATVAEAIIELIAETLDASPQLDAELVRSELAGATSALALLASGGHLRDGDLVLVAGTLRLEIEVPVGEVALAAEADIRPPRGAANADTWRLHLPAPDVLEPIVRSATQACVHATIDAAPDDEPAAASNSVSVDLSRLGKVGGQP